jgi:hypothetical protein
MLDIIEAGGLLALLARREGNPSPSS